MSRIALIYPKLKIFRNRNVSVTSVPLNLITAKNQISDVNIGVAFTTLNGGVKQVLQPRNLSTKSVPSSMMSTKPPSEVIQRDLYILAAKALAELLESKNGSNLVAEKRAHIFCNVYRTLQHTEKQLILDQLALAWSSQQDATFDAVKKYVTAQSKGESAAVIKAEDNLRNKISVDQSWLLSNLARQEGGMKFLIDIRADILEQITLDGPNVVAFRSLSNAIRDLIAPVFGNDMLTIERVTWSSPGYLLQNISEGEAVHPVRSWSDLKKRLGPYRRCFILSHPAVPKRPLAILHVALMGNITSSLNTILSRTTNLSLDSESDIEIPRSPSDYEDTQLVTTAIFYSISSTQKGLTGIDLGQCLITRAVAALQVEIPSIQQFSTLSPIPGFRSWLLHQLRETERGRETILTKFNWREADVLIKSSNEKPYEQLRQILVDSSWMKDDSKSQMLQNPLMRLCAHYLYTEKRRGFAVDSVANFHLRNGAMMYRLNWAADLSPRGLKNSFGMMMNYRYYLEAREKNSQSYVKKQLIESSEQIRHLAVFDNVSINSNLSRL